MKFKIQNSKFRIAIAAALLALAGCPGGGGGGGNGGGTARDSDGDGFTDEQEINAFPGSDPDDPTDTPRNPRDSDGDGCSDFDERTGADFCDSDPDGPSIVDTDGDGFTNSEEAGATPGSDPFDATDTPLNPRDSDGDGCSDFDELNFADFCDNDPNTGNGGGGGANRFLLRVSRHEDRSISAGEVDNIFAIAGELLQTVQPQCPDVAANVTFERDGAIETFDEGSAAVTTETQLDRLFDLPGDFKVVDVMIGVCGSGPSDMTTLLGCAISGGSVVIIADSPPDVWAHEWGHVQGLPHRDNCARNLMHATELETNAINDRERNAFLAPGPRGKTSNALVARSGPGDAWLAAMSRGMDESGESWVERVVSRRYRSGIPAELGWNLSLAPAAAQDEPRRALRRIVSEAPEGERRATAARLIGLTGGIEAVPDLIQAALAPAGELDRAGFNSCVESVLALGRLAPHDPSGAALGFLVQGSDPQSWSDAGIAWSFGSYQGERLHRLLARISIMALGLAGSQAAGPHLEVLEARVAAGELNADEFGSQVAEAIARSRGLMPKLSSGRIPVP